MASKISDFISDAFFLNFHLGSQFLLGSLLASHFPLVEAIEKVSRKMHKIQV